MSNLSHRVVETPVGVLRLVASNAGLVAVLWPDDPPSRVPLPPTSAEDDHPILAATADQLGEYFESTRRVFDLPLAPVGTPFQRSVWDALSAIPHGQTRSYGDLARAIGNPAAVRAVGAANGRNPLSIVVPCHRAIGSSGALTGFAGGVDAKRWLLVHEGALLA